MNLIVPPLKICVIEFMKLHWRVLTSSLLCKMVLSQNGIKHIFFIKLSGPYFKTLALP